MMVKAAQISGNATVELPSQGASLGRMVFGTLVVLVIIGLIAWVMRRVMPGHTTTNTRVIQQVGGLHLGPRERVVVLEVNGRWIVVGVHGNQMTALGDVPAKTEAIITNDSHVDHEVEEANTSFATRLQQAMQSTLQQKIKSFKSKP